MKVILAATITAAYAFCENHGIPRAESVIVKGEHSLEGLRFRYEDVIRVPGWSRRADVEEIEDRILRTHVTMGPVKSENDLNYNEIAVGYTFEKDFEEWKRNQ